MKAFRRRVRYVCSLVLVVALLAQFAAPLSAFGAPKPQPIPREVVEKRGPRSRVFDNGDGTYKYESFMERIHYRDQATGRFEKIETSLEETTTSAGKGWKNRANDFTLTLPKRLGQDWVTLEATQGAVSYRPAVNTWFGSPEEIPSTTGTVVPEAPETVRYSKVFGRDVSLEYESNPEGVKETIVLARRTGLTRFGFDMETTGLTPALEKDGSVALRSKNSTMPVFVIAPPYMEDSSADSNGDPVSSDQVRYEIVPVGLTWRLDVVADADWLADSERVYPVRIDPTVIYQNYGTYQNNGYTATMDSYVSSGSRSSNYGTSTQLRTGISGSYYESYLMPDVADLFAWNAINDIQIKFANMNMYCRSRANNSTGIVAYGPILGGWSETSITYNNKPPYSWAGQLNVPVGVRTRFPVGDIVQGWLDGAYANGACGFAFWANDYATFDSRHYSQYPIFEVCFTTTPKVSFSQLPAEVSVPSSPTASWAHTDIWGKPQKAYFLEVSDNAASVLAASGRIDSTATVATLPAPTGGWLDKRYYTRVKVVTDVAGSSFESASEWTPWAPFDIRPLTANSDMAGVEPYRAADSVGGGLVDLASGRLLLSRTDFSGPGLGGPLGVGMVYDSARTADDQGAGKGWRLGVPSLKYDDERAPNTGFETSDGAGGAAGWKPSVAAQVTRVSGGRTGSWALQLSSPTVATVSAASTETSSQTLLVYPGQRLLASAYIKTSGLTPSGTGDRGALLRVRYFNETGAPVGSAAGQGYVSNTAAAWHPLTLQADVPEGAFRADLSLEMASCSGTVSFDDVHFGDGTLLYKDGAGTTRTMKQVGGGIYQRDPLAGKLALRRTNVLKSVKPVLSGAGVATGASTDGSFAIANYDYVASNASGANSLRYELPNPRLLSQVNLYLWDGVETTARTYTYRVDVQKATDSTWVTVVPATTSRSWNLHTFDPVKARALRVVALGATADINLHLVEIELPVTTLCDSPVTFDSAGKITHVADTAGNVQHLDYDTSSRLTRVSDDAGRYVQVVRTGSVITSLDWHGIDSKNVASDETGVVRYVRGGADALTLERTLDVSQVAVATYEYDASGRISRITDADGVASTIAYQSGKVSTITQPGPTPVVTSYDYSVPNAVSITTAGGNDSVKRKVEFDPALGYQVTRVTADPGTGGANLASTFTYDSYGHLAAAMNPKGETDQFTTDPHGNVTKSVDRGGRTTTATYTNDRVSTFVDAKGNVSGARYDWAWRPVTSYTAIANTATGGQASSGEMYDVYGNQTRSDLPESTSRNLIDNPGFEINPFVAGGAWRRDPAMAWANPGTPAQPYMGRAYLQGPVGQDVNAVTDPKIPIVAGETYQVSVWTRGSGAVVVKEYNAAGTYLGEAKVISVTSGYVGLQRQVGSFVALVGATQADIWLQSTAAYGAAFDNVRLDKANAIGGDNWVENESMEYLPPSGPAYHWSLYNGTGYACDNVPTGSGGEDGVCLRIYGAPGTTSDAGQWRGQRIRVSPGESYSASILMKTSSVNAYGPTGEWGGSYAQVAMFADDASQSGIAYVTLTPSVPEDMFVQGDSDWTRYTARVDIPAGVTSLELFMALYQAEGYAWFDHAGLEPASDVATYGYDSTHTFRTSENTAGKRRLESDFDARGRVTESRYGDTAGVPATTKLTNATYDALDRLISVETARGSGLGITASYAYTDAGRLSSVTDPLGHVARMYYGADTGRMDRSVSPLGTEVDLSYDGLGRLKSVTKPHASGAATSALSTTDYDSVGRAWRSVSFGEGGAAATRTATFDALSRATSETLSLTGEPTASVSRTFDALGRVTSVVTTGPAGPVSASASFDLADLPLTQTLTALGAVTTVTNTFAKTNQWQTTQASFGSIWTFTTSVDGPVRQITSTLASVSRDYDERHRLTSVRTLAGAAAYGNYTLAYDTRDRIGSVSASVAGQTGTDTYLYDAADRLTSWTRTGAGAASETYEPLADGAMGKVHRGSIVTSFTYDADDRLVAAATAGVSTAYGNDLYGRRVTRVSPSVATTYTWNASGQLGGVTTRASSGATSSASYAYGISGMREAKTVVAAGTTRTTSSVWSGMQLASERDSDGTRLRFLYGPGGIPLELSVTTAGGTTTSYAFQLDAGGNVVALTNAAGVGVATYAYDPWGNPTSIGGTDAWLAARQPLRYRGYYLDTETGLYYLPARYYDPAVMRFLSADPAGPSAGSPLSLNAYAYCEGDPVNFDDPSGADPPGKGVNNPNSAEGKQWHEQMHRRFAAAAAAERASALARANAKVARGLADGAAARRAMAFWDVVIPTAQFVSSACILVGGMGLTYCYATGAGGPVSPAAADPSDEVAAAEAVVSVHGNSAASTRLCSLYRLYSNTGEYLKTGITQNPDARYPNWFMQDKYMDVISEGSRRGMLGLERNIVEVDPGIWNYESWAGVGR